MNEVNCSESDAAKRSVFDQVVMRYTPIRMFFYRDIKIGDKFTFNEFDKKDPFKEPPSKVTVINRKGRYIQFRRQFGSVDSLDLVSFLFCYIPDV